MRLTGLLQWAERHKPSASIRSQMLAGALVWTIVGVGLFSVGTVWTSHGSRMLHWAIPAAVVAGILKGRFVLQRAASRMVQRIVVRGDGRCLGGFQSWKSWLFVLGMVLLGRWLRSGMLPKGVVGLVYMAVGVALMVGAWFLWRARRDVVRKAPPVS